MPPTWIPICHSMQRYCEPYFAAVERWRSDAVPQILANRIHMIEAIDKVFLEYGQKKEIYEFDLICEYPDNGQLLPEFAPSQGKEYVYGGDSAAFAAARSLVPASIFNKVGLFYQNHLLKQLAGFNDQYLETANPETRKSLIHLVEKLFRVPNEAGKVRIVYRVSCDDYGNEFGKYRNLQVDEMTEATNQLVVHLIQFTALENPSKKRKIEDNVTENNRKRAKASMDRFLGGFAAKGGKSVQRSMPVGGRAGKETKRKETKSSNNDDPVDNWQSDHTSIGTKVAAYFEVGSKGQRKLYSGEVVKYAPPSSSRAKDQLYHIIWEDDDEEDYDQKQLDAAIQLYHDQTGWIEKGHESIGKRVAAYFSLDLGEGSGSGRGGKKGNKKSSQQIMSLFVGKVTKYSPPSKSEEVGEKGDQLYHIVWQDGDEEDYSEDEYQAGRQLYEEEEERKREDHPLGGDEVKHGQNDKEEEAEDAMSEDSEEEMRDEEDKEKRKEKEEKSEEESCDETEKKSESNGLSSSLFAMVEGIVDLLPEGMKEIKQTIKGSFTNTEDVTPTKVRTTRKQSDSTSSGRSSSTKAKKTPSSSSKAKGKTVKKNLEKSKNNKIRESQLKNEVVEVEEDEEDSEIEAEDDDVNNNDNKKDENNEDDDWTKDHSSVGTNVASYFPVGRGKQLFSGKVTRYAPETKKGAKDQLYHIVWQDDDEEDYSENEYQAAIKRYQTKIAKKSTSSSAQKDSNSIKGKKGGKSSSDSSSSAVTTSLSNNDEEHNNENQRSELVDVRQPIDSDQRQEQVATEMESGDNSKVKSSIEQMTTKSVNHNDQREKINEVSLIDAIPFSPSTSTTAGSSQDDSNLHLNNSSISISNNSSDPVIDLDKQFEEIHHGKDHENGKSEEANENVMEVNRTSGTEAKTESSDYF
jgi:hypothetical protein